MAYLNDNYLKLKSGYLFPEIARRVREFCEKNPEPAKRLIRCGIGDVTEPLPAAVVAALHKAVDEMAKRETFRGYGPEQGYDFLRNAIAQNDYRAHGLTVGRGPSGFPASSQKELPKEVEIETMFDTLGAWTRHG